MHRALRLTHRGVERILKGQFGRIIDSKSTDMPTVLRIGRYRFFFFSNEGREPPHIHVKAASDEAKFWLAAVELAANWGFNGSELNEIQKLVEEHREQLLEAWNDHLGAR